jgi:tight adherence protein C
MDFTFVDLLIMFIFIFSGSVFAIIGLKYFDTSDVRKRIDAFIIEPQESGLPRSLSELQNQNFSENLLQRTLFAWLNTIISWLGRYTPGQSVQEMNRRLLVAGNPFNFRAQQYYGLRLLLFLVGLVFSFLVFQSAPSSYPHMLIALCIILVCLVLPDLWLRITMKNRQDLIRRNLPDALDMLSVCTAAGLSFDQSLLRVGQTFKTPIGIEFARVVSEIEIGVSRQQALRNLQARADISELSSFVAVILQSESLGMSISDVMHAQAEQMRIYRQYRAKEAAQQLPAKMMVPLVLFIFPALLAVLLGPTLPVILEVLK